MKKSILVCLALLGFIPLGLGNVSAECDQNFYQTLRFDKQYTFRDEFNANSSDKWVQSFGPIKYVEQYDYNQSPDFPEFGWTQDIINAKGKVAKGTTMSVLKAKSPYPILAVPEKRSYDNLFLSYTITYSTDEVGNNKYSHTECGHYEISRCGDGVVDSNYGEVCDPKDTSKTGWGNGGCDNSCKPISVEVPECNSKYDGQKLLSLVDGSYLCTKGTNSEFKYDETTHKWTWKCGNTAGTKVDCSAIKPYCGDGVKDAGEACDPNDPNRTGWGDGGCDNSCNAVIAPQGCSQDFYETLRFDKQYTFRDEFNANSSDKWLQDWSVSYVEQYDYNQSPDFPKFDWTQEIIDAKGKVAKNTTMSVLKAKSAYPILAVPEKRSYDNLLLTYTIKYSTDEAGNNQYIHKECGHYEISWCGDGVIDSNYGEVCDPKDTSKTGWGNGGCDNSCKPITVAGPSCNSKYNGQRVSNMSEGNDLCSEGTYSEFKYDVTAHKWTWKCGNTAGAEVDCSAIKPYCGDGIKDEGEVCDPNDPSKTGWGNGGCDNSCKPITVAGPSCNSKYNGQRVSNMSEGNDLCSEGTYSEFKYDEITYKWTWKCGNTVGTKVDCSATKPYCGDGIKDEGEACDPKDPNKEGWSELGCDASCNVIVSPEGCEENQTFYDKLRYGYQYTFYDDFSAGNSTKWLRSWKMDYKEQYDYNQSPDFPKFDWTTELKDNDYKVAAKTTMTVLKAGSSYPILVLPKQRAYDNLFIKYTIAVSTDYAGTHQNPHSECQYYEITWCGDGILDKEYETCDPKDPNKEGWGDGGCDDATCKPIGGLLIDKKLVGSGVVESVGDTVAWLITVTAKGSDVTGFTVEDKMQGDVLGYQSYKINDYGGLNANDISNPVVEGNTITWNVTGTLKEGKSLVIEVTTYAKKMPEPGNKNVACVWRDTDPKTCEPEEFQPKLRIKKTFADGTKDKKKFKIGDTVEYKISFGNKGTAQAKIVSVKDFLPKNVEYLSSELYIGGEKKGTHSNTDTQTQQGEMDLVKNSETFKVVDGVSIDIFGGMIVNPGVEGYIILKGKITDKNLDTTKQNWACIYLDDKKPDDDIIDGDNCDYVEYEIDTNPPSGVLCESNIDKTKSKDLCYGYSWAEEVTCKSNGGSAKIEIFCDGKSAGSVENATQLVKTCTFSTDGAHTVKCEVNGSTSAVANSNCEGTYTLSHHSCGGGGGGCFIEGTQVIMADGTTKNIEEVEIGDEVMGSNGTINKVLGLHRPKGQGNLWSINGSKYFVSDEHPFKTLDGWKSNDPVGTRQELKQTFEDSEKNLEIGKLEVGDQLITDNGIVEVTKLESKKMESGTQLYNLAVDGDHTYYAYYPSKTETNGYLVHNKGGGGSYAQCKSIDYEDGYVVCSSSDNKAHFKLECDGKEFEYTDKYEWNHKFTECKNPAKAQCYVKASSNSTWQTNGKCKKTEQCINVNAGNFSIEEGEIFPFYWNMSNGETDAWLKKNSTFYVEVNGKYKQAKKNYDDFKGQGCGKGVKVGSIAKDSMVCTFNIYDGGVYNKSSDKSGKTTDNALYTIEGPCLAAQSAIDTNNLLKARYDAMVKKYCGDSKEKCEFYFDSTLPTAVYYIEGFGNNAKVNVNVGNGDDGFSFKKTPQDETKKSYGEYMIEFSGVKYLQCGGNNTWEQVIPDMRVCQGNFVLTNSYTVQKTPSGNLKASTQNLKKYLMINGKHSFADFLNAVETNEYVPNTKVNDAMDNFIKKYEKLAISVKSSSGKTIKKVPGKDIYFVEGDINLGLSSSDVKFNKAVTFVQTKGNTTINGSVEGLNMMLLTKGDIIFNGDCKTDQTVKGIFYAGGMLKRRGVNKNKAITNDFRCSNGGLHIQGVLIGNNFERLMKNSRSNLNDWFNSTDKRGIVMDGASVLIEYSPSVFTNSTMPPGAEDFVTALSIYKD